MEVLRKIFFVLGIILCAGTAFAQSNTVLQKAFHNSYVNEAAKSYSAAISDINPYYSDNSYEMNLRLGWLYYLNKNYPSSQSYYSKAAALRPGAVEAKFGYIKPLSFLQSWDKVLDQYQEILKLDPQNPQANYWAGIIYYNRKQFTPAIARFKAVVTLYPFDYDGNHMLAWANLMAGKKAEAKVYFEKALLIKPADESSTDGLSRSK
ncbi:tetratricopeptide repeat protein [Mucilaginibacter glaciei]|uniref:Tetratricopeptide repeat protein n=1 Tax=Mucilaginibacter glaciei TaxID=2772109 RepID=A0A926NN25_9SPHI|nr:tetratricopeptide repeat protein [Mucilaginibacter glaciei]MBD1391552.1 tetratricopeptide repeat protein [Mucilaginibacter glaciei]